MRPGAFVPMRWRLPECMRLILPFAVILKRFLAPRCVFSFSFGFVEFLGMALNALLDGRGLRRRSNSIFPGNRSAGTACPYENQIHVLLRLLGVGRWLAAGLGYRGAFFRR